MILYFKEIKYNTYAISTSRKCSIYCALSVLHNPMKEDINRTLIAVTTDIKRFQIWSRYSLLDKRMHAHVKRELMKIYPFRRRRRACNKRDRNSTLRFRDATDAGGMSTRTNLLNDCNSAQSPWSYVYVRKFADCQSVRMMRMIYLQCKLSTANFLN